MEADKSQDLQTASWRPRKAYGVVLIQSWQAGDQGRAHISVQVQRQEKKSVQLKTFRQEEFLLTKGDLVFFVLFRPLTD
jgi:hypothetical protein